MILRKKITLVFINCILLSALFSCKKHKEMINDFTKDGLAVEVMKIDGGPDNSSDLNLSARLVPDKKLAAVMNNTLKTEMTYRMDSCFYLQEGQKKIYADMVQPIANGIAGTFEYMVSFGVTPAKDKWSLVYQDKYLNHKKYTLRLNN